MSYFISKWDSQVSIYKINDVQIGYDSQYRDIPVPATGNTIKGFEFDETVWAADTLVNNHTKIPVVWDSHLGQDRVSGIGDDEDCLVENIEIEYLGQPDDQEDTDFWSPRINHGYFYDTQSEFYLFSDDSITVYPRVDQYHISDTDITISGGNYLDLEFNPKSGIPVLARTYRWDSNTGSYLIDDIAYKVDEFSSTATDNSLITVMNDSIFWDNLSLGKKEFITQDLRFIFNQQVSTSVGRIIPNLLSYNDDELEATESVATTLNQSNERHHLQYSPVDRYAPIQIFLESVGTTIEYTVVEEFTVGGTEEVIIDYDLGILRFGTDEAGGVPPVGYTIHASYNKTMAVEYEPEYSRDYLLGKDTSNTNPINKFTADGFIFLKSKSQDIESLILSAELPEISENYFGPTYIGNSFSRIVGTVLDTEGLPVEGQRVRFEILSGFPTVNFSGDSIAFGISNSDGEAKTILTPPRTITDVGGVTDTVLSVSGLDALQIEGYTPPSLNESLFVFAIHTTDDILGIPKADLLTFYEDYIQEQETLSSQTKGPLIDIDISNFGSFSWISGAFEDFIKWEILHRAYFDLQTPTTYEVGDIRTGKKTIVSELDATAVNPHTGTTPAFVPLQPSTYELTESGVLLSFDSTLPAIGATYKGYLVTGPILVTLRASTINERDQKTIYSNEIDILIDINDSAKGLQLIDTINSMPSGLLNNAHFWDSEVDGLEHVQITASGLLPIGWRLRSPGITLASALDGITFLDINPLTDPSDTIGFSFTVEV